MIYHIIIHNHSHSAKINHFLDVSKNRGTPKWMVKIMENPIKMDDLGGFNPLFSLAHPCSHKNVLLETVQKRC